MAYKILAWETADTFENYDIDSYTWTVPADWNNSNNKIEVIGFSSGGGGSGVGSGGGGAYASSSNISLVPGTTVYIKPVSNSAFYSSSFVERSTMGAWINWVSNNRPTSNTDGVFAAAGWKDYNESGQMNSGGGPGGSASNSVGQVVFSGGNGGAAGVDLSSGGGGGAAGPEGPGKNGGAGDTSSGGQEGGGGGGGAGGVSSTAGSNAGADGGAGGAGSTGTAGGAGGSGGPGGDGSNGSGGGGGDQARAGGKGGDGIGMGVVTDQASGNGTIAIGTTLGPGGGCGGYGGISVPDTTPSGTKVTGPGKWGGGRGGFNSGNDFALGTYFASFGLVVITYDPIEPSLATGNMFMLFN